MFAKAKKRNYGSSVFDDVQEQVNALALHANALPAPRKRGKGMFGKGPGSRPHLPGALQSTASPQTPPAKANPGGNSAMKREKPKEPGRFDIARLLIGVSDALGGAYGANIRAFDDQRNSNYKTKLANYNQQSTLDSIFGSQGGPSMAAVPSRSQNTPQPNAGATLPYLPAGQGQAGAYHVPAGGSPGMTSQASGQSFSPAMQQLARANPQAFLSQYMEGEFENRSTMQQRTRNEAMADEYGLSGHSRLAFLANPEEYGDSLATNFEASNVGAGESRVFGDGRPAFHNTDYIGLLDAENDAARNNVARYGHDVTADGHSLSYQSDMAKNQLGYSELDLARQVEAREAAGGGDQTYGLTPEYVQLPNGDYVPVQMSKQGGAQVVPMPDGLPDGTRFAGPADVAGQRSYGAARGKADAVRETGLPKQAQMLQTFGTKVDQLDGWIDQAINQVNDFNTGPLAQHNPFAGGTDLSGTIKSIVANSGFDELQRMRDESPTGGALGQVTEREISLLQALKGNLERSQSPEQLVANLTAYKSQYRKSLTAMQSAYQRDMEAGLFNAPAQSEPRRPLDYVGHGSGSGAGWSPQDEDELARLTREMEGGR